MYVDLGVSWKHVFDEKKVAQFALELFGGCLEISLVESAAALQLCLLQRGIAHSDQSVYCNSLPMNPKHFFFARKIKKNSYDKKKGEDADLRSMCGKRTRNRNRSCTLGKFKLTQIQKMQIPNFKNLSYQWLCLLGWPDGQLGIHKRQNWKFIYCWRCTGGLI